MKKYKLKDLISSGSGARKKVDSDVIVGDISQGFGYGDILDANSVMALITNVFGVANEELQQKIDEFVEENRAIDEQQQQAINNIGSSGSSAHVDGDNLILSGISL